MSCVCCTFYVLASPGLTCSDWLVLLARTDQWELTTNFKTARRTGSDGSMSASGSAGPGFDPRRGSKFSFENFQPRS